MNNIQLGVVEAKFADLIWANAPIGSGALVKLAETEMNWKRSTTLTVLRRLCEKGLFKNEKGGVFIVLTREEFYAKQSARFVEDHFDNSLNAFLTAFVSEKKLSDEDVAKLKKMIEDYEGQD